MNTYLKNLTKEDRDEIRKKGHASREAKKLAVEPDMLDAVNDRISGRHYACEENK